ncbi:MAG TPA: glycosyltransferase [Acidothermaceae bacterium]
MGSGPEPLRRLTVVVLTHNRRDELAVTLDHLVATRAGGRPGGLAGAPDIVVIDNASTDHTAGMVTTRFPGVRLITLARNVGGAGRNVGVAAAPTPYVAFCDDDTWWAAGSLEAAVAMLDTAPRVAVVCGRVLVGREQRVDQVCAGMARSPLGPGDDFAGYPVLGFLAGACVVRSAAFTAVGGFDERFFVGGEEELVALDLAARGWELRYAPAVVVHHHPSANRDDARRRVLTLRNRLWVGLLRYPAGLLMRQAARVWDEARRQGVRRAVLADAARGLPWVLRGRRPLPVAVRRQLELLECHCRDTLGSPT